MSESSGATPSEPPAIAVPKGGGAIRGIDEKFAANPATGTGSLTVPIPVSPGRSGFGPSLSLRYDSGAGTGPFGLGWSLDLPAITRATDKALPRYDDAAESDTFVLAGSEELVPELDASGARVSLTGQGHRIDRYRPRVESAFTRIERWTRDTDAAVHWRTVSADNVTTVYGEDAGSRIADPADPRRVFSWLACQRYDDRGNAIRFEYKAENADGVDLGSPEEANRTPAGRSANRYLKRIRYGNRVSQLTDEQLSPDWAFEVVFDYGEHDQNTPAETATWLCRADPTSSYRAGFEVRGYRLCHRVLMFHHFPGEPGVGAGCLVRATELGYTGDRIAALLSRITATGYRRAGTGYLTRSLPPLELDYQQARWHDEVRELDAETLAGLPYGLAGPGAHWVDLDGDGLSGVLVEHGGSWLYHRNEGGGRLAPALAVASQPSPGALGRTQLLDLAGNGTLDVVDLTGAVPGFFERDGDGWGPFRTFEELPTGNLAGRDTRLVDLTGDGHADLLRTETEGLTWYPSQGGGGFGEAEHHSAPLDEDSGPSVVFDDSIYVADMSGDGLPDLVRVRNGEACYWPNLGYGRFGARVCLAGAPTFDAPESFDQRRVRLSDVDGSGPADLIYLGADGVRLWRNESGNGFAGPHRIDHFPPVDGRSTVTVTDLLGTGTACLVWTSPLPADAGHQARYLDLMGGVKPHLLIGLRNNLGAETRIGYASSTAFLLADRATGRPWATRLPFPVQVVERVETIDHVSRNRFVTRYAYHHGYFDGTEREFRGFGMVEQLDAETIGVLTEDDPALTSPPVLTRTWYHTGWFDPSGRISRHYEQEYWPGDPTVALQDTVLPAGLSDVEVRQACRALRGTMLRQEVYAQDGGDREPLPYQVSERNTTVRLLQPAGGNRYAAFHVHERESVTATYERTLYPVGGQQLPDPRITHELTLDVDAFGNVQRSASIGYGRRHPDPDLSAADQTEQRRLQASAVDNRYTNAVLGTSAYRTPLLAESRHYELLNLPEPAGLFTLEAVREAFADAPEIPFDNLAGTGMLAKRIIANTRTLYRRDDLTGPLPLGTLESLALPYQGFRLALTSGLVSKVYGDQVDDAALLGAGYVHSGDTGWWIPSVRAFYSADPMAAELLAARAHFFLPARFVDPFGAATTVEYDSHDLLPIAVRDALGNRTASGNDYRVLAPALVTDPNGNRSAVAFDALGMVVATAIMGKAGEPAGDTLTGLPADLSEEAVLADLADPLAGPHALLGPATTRLVYDLFAYHRTRADAQPQGPVVHTMARETHGADLAPGQQTRIRHSLTYSDGFGRVVQTKAQAEPGPLTEGGPAVPPRWVGSGWTVYNNKGQPVRSYEPFFTGTHRFESGRTAGVSPVHCYDPIQRAVATLHPDHTWDKAVFDPWRQVHWDVNDTVLLDPRTDQDLAPFASLLPAVDYLPTWHEARAGGALGEAERAAAVKAAVHAATPTVTHLDALGRPFLTVAHNRSTQDGAQVDERIASRVVLDIEGNQREARDAAGRAVARNDYALGSVPIRHASMESGVRRTLPDVTGTPCRTWDSRDHRQRTEYDALRRPTAVWLRTGSGQEILVSRTTYGESLPDAEQRNLRGSAYQSFDTAGVGTVERRDFKGNPLRSTRRFTEDYRETPDWSANPALEAESYLTASSFDALNRPTQLIAPHAAELADIVQPRYNEAGLPERIDVWTRRPVPAGPLDPATADLAAVTGLEHDAAGRRTRIEHGNGVTTDHSYDPWTFRLRRTVTRRGTLALQDLRYTYDPAGNVTAIRDDAQQTVFFRNQIVEPHGDYTYDALYRLVEATGREHLAGAAPGPTDAPRVGLAHPGDGTAMSRYAERYRYDQVGNLLELVHQSSAAAGGWTRRHTYAEPSQLQADRISNRLTTTRVGAGPAETYRHDAHGNLTSMPHLPLLEWDFADRLLATTRQVAGAPETTYYAYDGSGQRVRKITERAGAAHSRAVERRYLGGFELHREYAGDGGTITVERQTLHVLDGTRRVVLIETRTLGTDPGAANLVRFQHGNHLGSAVLELDGAGQIISYEEYHPYGSTSYQAVRAQTETPKRYRYSGRERDTETGLAYHGARYYAPWLGRWTAADPAGLVDGPNRYAYVRGNPLLLTDPNGRECDVSESCSPLPVSTSSTSDGPPRSPVPPALTPSADLVAKAWNRAHPPKATSVHKFPAGALFRRSGVLLGWDEKTPTKVLADPDIAENGFVPRNPEATGTALEHATGRLRVPAVIDGERVTISNSRYVSLSTNPDINFRGRLYVTDPAKLAPDVELVTTEQLVEMAKASGLPGTGTFAENQVTGTEGIPEGETLATRVNPEAISHISEVPRVKVPGKPATVAPSYVQGAMGKAATMVAKHGNKIGAAGLGIGIVSTGYNLGTASARSYTFGSARPLLAETIRQGFVWGFSIGVGALAGAGTGAALGTTGGPAAPATVPAGAVVGAFAGGIAGSVAGGVIGEHVGGKVVHWLGLE